MSNNKRQLDSERLFDPESMGTEPAHELASLYRRRQFHECIPPRERGAAVLEFTYEEREVLYRHVNDSVLMNGRIDYLEFGVAGGESLRSWRRINTHPGSRFIGFDSFQGLPEDWQEDTPAGSFSTGGAPPRIGDARVSCVEGLFQETLPEFSCCFERRDRLVLHLDADLYSSTLYALMQFDRHMRPGDVLVFDEFIARDCMDEFAALQDFCAACGRDWELVARRRDYVKVALRITR